MGNLRPSRLQYAQRYHDSTSSALALTRLSVLTSVRRTFYQVLRRRGELTIAQENLRLAEDLRQRTQVRVDVGEAGRLELVRSDAEVTDGSDVSQHDGTPFDRGTLAVSRRGRRSSGGTTDAGWRAGSPGGTAAAGIVA
ncbi:MAG: TolC family protein [Acidobacteriota bacterium]